MCGNVLFYIPIPMQSIPIPSHSHSSSVTIPIPIPFPRTYSHSHSHAVDRNIMNLPAIYDRKKIWWKLQYQSYAESVSFFRVLLWWESIPMGIGVITVPILVESNSHSHSHVLFNSCPAYGITTGLPFSLGFPVPYTSLVSLVATFFNFTVASYR